MTKTIDVVYEDDVLKPLMPIEGLKRHERLRVILCHFPDKKELRKLAGTLTQKEAEEMQGFINQEFERIEGEW